MPKYKVTVIAIGDDMREFNLGTVAVSAETDAESHTKALDQLWDNRLDSASCTATFKTELMPQYIVANGWSHIFEGFGQREVRFVFDIEAEKIAFMDMFFGVGEWKAATAAQIADVEDSLKNANEDALKHPEDWGLEGMAAFPDWAANPRSLPKARDLAAGLAL